MGRQTDIGFICQTPPPANLEIPESLSKVKIFKASTGQIEMQFTDSGGDRLNLTINNSGLALWDPETATIVWDTRHHDFIPSTRDWNSLSEGTYYFSPDSLGGNNAPSTIGYKYGMVHVIKQSQTICTQIAYPHNSNKTGDKSPANVMMRQYYGSTWSAWRNI